MMTLVHKHMHIYAHAWPWCMHLYEHELVHRTHSNLGNYFQLEQLYLFQFCYYYFFGFSVLLSHPHWAHIMWPKLALNLQTSCFKFLNTISLSRVRVLTRSGTPVDQTERVFQGLMDITKFPTGARAESPKRHKS